MAAPAPPGDCQLPTLFTSSTSTKDFIKMASSSPKKIRSQPPDVIVAVGRGDKKQRFECYKVVLSFASPYLDAMLSSDMVERNTSQINFPGKDPEEWKLFHQIIMQEMEVDGDNARILTPWFHEFQMAKHLGSCDLLLASAVNKLGSRDTLCASSVNKPNAGMITKQVWGSKSRMSSAEKSKRFTKIVELLEFACVYDLERTKEMAEAIIKGLLGNVFLHNHELFSMPIIHILVDLFLPLGEHEGKVISQGKSGVFFASFIQREVESALKTLSLDEVNNNPMLPVLISVAKEKEVALANAIVYESSSSSSSSSSSGESDSD